MPAGLPQAGQKMAASGPSSATAATLPPLSSTGTVSRRCLGSFWSIMIFFTVRPGRPGRSSRSPVLRERTVSPSAPASQNSRPDWGSPWYTAAAQVRVHSPVRSCPGMGRGCLLQCRGRSLPGEHQHLVLPPGGDALRQIQPGRGVPPPAPGPHPPQMGGGQIGISRPARPGPAAAGPPGAPRRQADPPPVPRAGGGSPRGGGSPPPPFPPDR